MADAPNAKDLAATVKMLNEVDQLQKGIAKSTNEVTKALKGETAELQRTNDAFEKSVEEVGDFKKSVDEAEKMVEGLADAVEDAAWKKDNYENVKKYKEALGKAKTTLNKMKNIPITDKKQFKKLQAEYKKQLGVVGALQKGIEGTGKISGRAMKEMVNAGSSVSGMFGAIGRKSPKDLKAAAMAGKGVAASMSKAADVMKGMPGLLGVAGKAVGGVGVAVGGVSKLMAGPVGWAAIIGKAIIDIEMKADQFLKNQNKIFAQIRGPDIMTSDVKGQFKDFNDQIFNMGHNLKIGFNAKQIQEFFENMSAAGISVSKLNNGMQSYKDVLDVAARASRTFGVSLGYMGVNMTELMIDYKADLQSVDKLFTQVAFDAGKSGLSADKFWSAVKNSTSSLGLYGIAISGVSKTLAKWTQDQVGGAKEATEAAASLTGALKGKSVDTIKILGMAIEGGLDAAAMIRDEKKKATEALDLAKKSGNKGLAQQIQNRIDTFDSLLASYSRGGPKSSEFMAGMAANMPEFAGQAEKIFTNVFAGGFKGSQKSWDEWINRGGEGAVAAEQMAEQFGITANDAKYLATTLRTSYNTLDAISKLTFKGITLDESQLSQLTDVFSNMANSNEQVQEQGIEDLTKVLVKGGVEEDMASNLAKLAAVNPEVRDAVQEMVSTGSSDTTKLKGVLSGVRGDQKKFFAYSLARSKYAGKTADNMAIAADDTSQKIKEGTLSWNEMVEIGMDQAKYFAASISGASQLNDMVNGILTIMDKDGEQRRIIAKKNMENTLKTTDWLKKATGGITDLKDDKTQKAAVTGLLQAEKTMNNLPTEMAKVSETLGTADKTGPTATMGQKQQEQGIASINELLKSPGMAGSETEKQLQGYLAQLTAYKPGATDAKQQSIALKRNLDVATAGIKSTSLVDSKMIRSVLGDASKMSANAKNLIEGKAPSETPFIPYGGTSYGRANMREPQRITSPGMVKLDPGEIIAPGNFARSTLATIPASPGMPNTGGGLGGKNISISVNAVEKDLASRIANEVRAVLYKERLV